MALSPNVQGALWMAASMAGFGINDALIKSVAGEMPLFQAMLVRGAIASVVILAIAWRAGVLTWRPGRSDGKWLAFRTAGEVGATCLFLTALFNMPLANATAIIGITALAVTLAAALFLREPVGWRRYSAIVLGFAGVLLIVKPGTEGFNVYSLAALGAVGFVVLRDLGTRQLSDGVPGLFATVLTAVTITLAGAVMTMLGDWAPLAPEPTWRLGLSAGFLLIGYYTGLQAMRVGEVGFVSPFRYLNLIWALVLGYLFFAELPDGLALAGAALVVATGLYTLHRERVRAEEAP
ncbi:MAG: DMT family transporter [Pseudomonadota bacterium]